MQSYNLDSLDVQYSTVLEPNEKFYLQYFIKGELYTPVKVLYSRGIVLLKETDLNIAIVQGWLHVKDNPDNFCGFIVMKGTDWSNAKKCSNYVHFKKEYYLAPM